VKQKRTNIIKAVKKVRLTNNQHLSGRGDIRPVRGAKAYMEGIQELMESQRAHMGTAAIIVVALEEVRRWERVVRKIEKVAQIMEDEGGGCWKRCMWHLRSRKRKQTQAVRCIELEARSPINMRQTAHRGAAVAGLVGTLTGAKSLTSRRRALLVVGLHPP